MSFLKTRKCLSLPKDYTDTVFYGELLLSTFYCIKVDEGSQTEGLKRAISPSSYIIAWRNLFLACNVAFQ